LALEETIVKIAMKHALEKPKRACKPTEPSEHAGVALMRENHSQAVLALPGRVYSIGFAAL
jgi:hypothetical protein